MSIDAADGLTLPDDVLISLWLDVGYMVETIGKSFAVKSYIDLIMFQLVNISRASDPTENETTTSRHDRYILAVKNLDNFLIDVQDDKYREEKEAMINENTDILIQTHKMLQLIMSLLNRKGILRPQRFGRGGS